MKKRTPLLLFACFICSLLTAQSTVAGSIHHDGLTRTYTLYIPAIYNPSHPTPLVFNLHGYSSNGSQQMIYADFRPIADTANFLLLVPEGTVLANNQFWNVGFFDTNVDDIGFLTSLIDSLSLIYNINQNRIYSTGMSNGGFMSYNLACHSDRFAAIASVAGSIVTDSLATCMPARPIPVMEVHGTADLTVPYEGTTLFKPIEEVVNYWVAFNHCNTTPVISNVPDVNLIDGATAQHIVYNNGDEGTSVEFYKIINGAHTWPGAPFIIGTTCEDFSACREIWRFFSQFSLPTGTQQPAIHTESDLVFPNPAQNAIHIRMTQSDIISVQVISMDGNTVLSGLHTNQLDIHTLPAGMYLVKIETAKGFFTRKWCKMG